MNKTTTIKLNLVMTYPIAWSVEHIMEDYIQNFYDVLGPENFSIGFHTEYDESRKLLRLESQKGFSVEWLKYIGASAKGTAESPYTAGKFGEGFKIASLCAYRDHNINIRMESRDWHLEVVRMPDSIDGQAVEFLGYDIYKRPYTDNAVLLLENVNQDAYQKFLGAMNRFYYPENPLFGACIAKGRKYAVYQLNPNLISRNGAVCGKVFASMQERAEIRNIPLIFCNHTYEPDREDDRDRRSFENYDITEAVTEIVSKLDGDVLKEVFIMFQPYWLRPDRAAKHGPNWTGLIKKMVCMIAEEDRILQEIREFLKEDYIADVYPFEIGYDRNKYKTALAWFRASCFHGTRKLLPCYFSRLGIESLYTLCERHDGFHVIQTPNPQQQKQIRILEHMASELFADLLCYEELPACRVIVNKGTPHEGFATTFSSAEPIRNALGLKVVSIIREINLREELFRKDSFPQAMAVYMHELLHQFGADASMQFRIAILAMNYRIMECSEKLESYEKKWSEYMTSPPLRGKPVSQSSSRSSHSQLP